MGFFGDDPPPIARKPKAAAKLIIEGATGCDNCGLKACWPRLASPQMRMHMLPDADILVLGEAPDEIADRQGRPMVGDEFALIGRTIPPRELNRVAYQNLVRCFPNGVDAGRQEAHACSQYLEDDIARLDPKAILGMGPAVYYALITDLSPGEATLFDMYGLWLPVFIAGKVRWFMPTFSYSMLVNGAAAGGRRWKQKPEDQPMWPVMRANIRRFFDEVDRLPAPEILKFNPADVIEVTTLQDARDLRARMDPTLIGTDVETSELRPYNKGARLLSNAFTDGEITFAYAINHPGRQHDWAPAFTRETLEWAHGWIAHNAAFEWAWYNFVCGLPIDPTKVEDSMALARLKYEREKTTSLACMSRIVLGANVKALTNINTKNMLGHTIDEILPYNGLDPLASLHAFLREKPNLRQDENYRSIVEATASTTQMQMDGLPVSLDVSLGLKAKWEAVKAGAQEKALGLYEVKSWLKQYQQEFNVGNDDQLTQALVEFGNVKLPKNASGKGWKADETTLLACAPDNPVVLAALDFREAAKLCSTYIEPFIEIPKKTVDGLIHPCYTTMLVRTLRLSSEDPNIQNVPNRKNSEMRGQVVAPEGHIIVAFDYGQIQVRIVGICSKDQMLNDSILNGRDMHKHWRDRTFTVWPDYFDHVMARCGETDEEKVNKAARNEIKNDFVFAGLFGSDYRSIARNLRAPEEIMKQLQGEFYEEHPDVKRWQDARRKEYKETGAVRMLTGWSRHDIMTGNEPINTPIQGIEANVVAAAMNECSALARSSGDKYYQPRMQVHDDLTFILPLDDRLDGYIGTIANILLKVRWRWQILPWTVEAKAGYAWDKLEEFGVFKGDYVR